MKNNFSKKGFTLVEIMIVVAIIGVIATIAIPAFVRAREQARKKVCIANQRSIFGAAMVYEINEEASLQDAGSRKSRLTTLIDEGYIKGESGYECPSSPTKDYDDYEMIFDSDGYIVDIECQIEPAKHKWPEETPTLEYEDTTRNQ